MSSNQKYCNNKNLYLSNSADAKHKHSRIRSPSEPNKTPRKQRPTSNSQQYKERPHSAKYSKDLFSERYAGAAYNNAPCASSLPIPIFKKEKTDSENYDKPESGIHSLSSSPASLPFIVETGALKWNGILSKRRPSNEDIKLDMTNDLKRLLKINS
ncbi:hypothetical protein ROZALSC1DRAFT_24571 [Rozella allomycis CSF55]|uniref:Uncharacterized protein n=1 Tax=Rozella allomycis (strain CSF55) TaxID=988480 RepID=A0A4P9YCR0_ROZAC|nr:hypothetical protein ROZALSC1DRAFT_24571 [Rozella allomycis CSF55]